MSYKHLCGKGSVSSLVLPGIDRTSERWFLVGRSWLLGGLPLEEMVRFRFPCMLSLGSALMCAVCSVLPATGGPSHHRPQSNRTLEQLSETLNQNHLNSLLNVGTNISLPATYEAALQRLRPGKVAQREASRARAPLVFVQAQALRE